MFYISFVVDIRSSSNIRTSLVELRAQTACWFKKKLADDGEVGGQIVINSVKQQVSYQLFTQFIPLTTQWKRKGMVNQLDTLNP